MDTHPHTPTFVFQHMAVTFSRVFFRLRSHGCVGFLAKDPLSAVFHQLLWVGKARGFSMLGEQCARGRGAFGGGGRVSYMPSLTTSPPTPVLTKGTEANKGGWEEGGVPPLLLAEHPMKGLEHIKDQAGCGSVRCCGLESCTQLANWVLSLIGGLLFFAVL